MISQITGTIKTVSSPSRRTDFTMNRLLAATRRDDGSRFLKDLLLYAHATHIHPVCDRRTQRCVLMTRHNELMTSVSDCGLQRPALNLVLAAPPPLPPPGPPAPPDSSRQTAFKGRYLTRFEPTTFPVPALACITRAAVTHQEPGRLDCMGGGGGAVGGGGVRSSNTCRPSSPGFHEMSDTSPGPLEKLGRGCKERSP
ncbi:unnamed protein product [Pleuronectes platessa]|uniref:Uncharacterized protein n=1 Tax=Pleuronectes platessa TaxID=8262 RepID=A0A9N7YRC0_PLEPL|nr:unnamed protein product [Pleuronectes platessa]